MSNQGTASNRGGQAFEDLVADLLDQKGIVYQRQVKRPGPNPNGHRRDFEATIHNIKYILECKAFSGQPGSIWEKIPYTINSLDRGGRKSIVILGGTVPTDWRRGFLMGMQTPIVSVWTIDQFEDYLNNGGA